MCEGSAVTDEIVVYYECVLQVCEVSAECQVKYELETRFQQLQSRLAVITLETEEVCTLFVCPIRTSVHTIRDQ